MFEDTLLIIKPDYLHKRTPVLLYLLEQDFFIQGNRKLQFTPELAAEFHKGDREDEQFLVEALVLSKGVSEAFILRKNNAVEALNATMICYFGNTKQMKPNVHYSENIERVQYEITFIFPNYISEPIFQIDKLQFCKQDYIRPLFDHVYDMLNSKDDDDRLDWKCRLAEWLKLSNRALPIVTNRCSTQPVLNLQDKEQQTNIIMPIADFRQPQQVELRGANISRSSSTLGITPVLSSSSCISCMGFDDKPCSEKKSSIQPSLADLIRRRKQQPRSVASSTTTQGTKRTVEEPSAPDYDTYVIDEEWPKILTEPAPAIPEEVWEEQEQEFEILLEPQGTTEIVYMRELEPLTEAAANEPEEQPEAQPETQPEAQPETQPEIEPEVEAPLIAEEAEQKPEIEAEPQPEMAAEAAVEPEAQIETIAVAGPEPDVAEPEEAATEAEPVAVETANEPVAEVTPDDVPAAVENIAAEATDAMNTAAEEVAESAPAAEAAENPEAPEETAE